MGTNAWSSISQTHISSKVYILYNPEIISQGKLFISIRGYGVAYLTLVTLKIGCGVHLYLDTEFGVT